MEQPTRESLPDLGLGEGRTTPHRKTINMLRNVTQDLRTCVTFRNMLIDEFLMATETAEYGHEDPVCKGH